MIQVVMKNKLVISVLAMCALLSLAVGQTPLYLSDSQAGASALPSLAEQREFKLTSTPAGNIFVSGRTIADDQTVLEQPKPETTAVKYRLVSIFDAHKKPAAIFVSDDGEKKLTAYEDDVVEGLGVIEFISPREVVVVGPEGEQITLTLFKVKRDAQEKTSATDKDQ